LSFLAIAKANPSLKDPAAHLGVFSSPSNQVLSNAIREALLNDSPKNDARKLLEVWQEVCGEEEERFGEITLLSEKLDWTVQQVRY
jgi:hypothetical protein